MRKCREYLYEVVLSIRLEFIVSPCWFNMQYCSLLYMKCQTTEWYNLWFSNVTKPTYWNWSWTPMFCGAHEIYFTLWENVKFRRIKLQDNLYIEIAMRGRDSCTHHNEHIQFILEQCQNKRVKMSARGLFVFAPIVTHYLITKPLL